jgi:hypothetical protein
MARDAIAFLASSAPKGAAGMHGWAAEVMGAVGTHVRQDRRPGHAHHGFLFQHHAEFAADVGAFLG